MGKSPDKSERTESSGETAAKPGTSPSEPLGPEPGADGERTSEFVPLKPLDGPPKPPVREPVGEEAPAPAPDQPPPAQDARREQPPLDLLAQLTNAPAPPGTVARTVRRRLRIWTPLVALLALVFVTVQALRPLPNPKLALTGTTRYTFQGARPELPWPIEGQAVVDIDGLGRMGSYGDMSPLPIGSVAKVMTAYLVLKDHPLKEAEAGPDITVDQKAEDDYTNGVPEKESVVEVRKGQQISEREAIEAIMLPSANNVARLLARWDAGSEQEFIKKMNSAAAELGMTKTQYTDASGLLESTVSTAEDQVKLAERAMADPVFRAIVKMPSYDSTTTSGGSTVETAKKQSNFNKLVPLYGVVGIKTGSTTKAGGNLLFAAEKTVGGTKQLIIGAVFGQHKPSVIDTATQYSKELILAAGEQLKVETAVRKGQVVGTVDDGLGGSTPIAAAGDMAVVGWPGATVTLDIDDNGKGVPHQAQAGTRIGSLTAGAGTGRVAVPVTLNADLTEPSFGSKLLRLG
ncbi:D-alanyl-D-alanine carboxypeptidase [Streptomyces sp. RPT161]|uniref:D-alanyl-D-alanine carboxypeptidase n=1 Tax=Streptomyces sp. RPT161 TaxID=3015993 RepID=UPI0022B91C4A|nr:D-alanyl-D-alanine carboxypeptidase [Streptomyces sp. RPT161]